MAAIRMLFSWLTEKAGHECGPGSQDREILQEPSMFKNHARSGTKQAWSFYPPVAHEIISSAW
jgi:hypothetical protein